MFERGSKVKVIMGKYKDLEGTVIDYRIDVEEGLMVALEIGNRIHTMSENAFEILQPKKEPEYIVFDITKQPGGYVNKNGVRVPNPCREIDLKGRDMDKIYRNAYPSDDLTDEETLDRLNNLVEFDNSVSDRYPKLEKR